MLIDRDAGKALDYCKGVISDLLQNRVDLSLLVITKGLGKKTNAPPEGGEEGAKPAASTQASGKQY
jgi:DNA polymerase elongation subunit (family B)